jgi:hypothetical protein
MIHYDKLAKDFAEAQKAGKLLILEVHGMLPVNRYGKGHEKEGEPIPPKIANGTLVKVTAVGPDNVMVATEDGKTEVVFSHMVGANRLNQRKDAEFPKPAK